MGCFHWLGNYGNSVDTVGSSILINVGDEVTVR